MDDVRASIDIFSSNFRQITLTRQNANKGSFINVAEQEFHFELEGCLALNCTLNSIRSSDSIRNSKEMKHTLRALN